MQAQPEHQYFLYTPKPGRNPYFDSAKIRTSPSRYYSYWRRKSILYDLIRDEIDAYHGLSQELPLGIDKTKIYTKVTIHDMIAFSHPKTFPWMDRRIYQHKIRHACSIAKEIACVSEYTFEQLNKFLGNPKAKISIEHPPLPLHLRVKPSKDITAKWQKLLPDSFLIYFGGYGPRKSVGLLIEAMAQLQPDELPYIVFAGAHTSEVKALKAQAQKLGVHDHCLFIGYVPEEEVSSLYALATAAVYPSYAEGFGLPVLEAYHLKIPILCSDLPVFREAGGTHPTYLEPQAEVWAKAMQEFA